MVYKTLKKVSNVCQLVDKRKYNPTETKSGVTFTNNGDGTITVNGTSTQLVGFYLQNINFIENHTYLLMGCPSGGSNSTYIFYMLDTGASIGIDKGNGTISKPLLFGNRYIAIYVFANTTCNNVIFKPQLFDLTEMYGAGNEPTTVEQFRQDFPDELYDYSPYCWLTSYKRVFLTGNGKYLTSYKTSLVCKTKNLFDISKVTQSNFIQSNDKDIICSSYGSSIGLLKNLCPSLKVGDIATLSLIVKSTTGVPPVFVQIQGQILYVTTGSVTFTVTEDGLNSDFYLYNTTFENMNVPTTTVFTDIMIELGDAATDFVPYGHL